METNKFSSINKSINTKIKVKLAENDMTYKSCSEQMGISTNMFSRIMSGKCRWTSSTAAKAIKVFPDLTFDDFFKDYLE